MSEMTDFQKKIGVLFPKISICFEEPLSKHTSFRIGGPAEAMAFPKNREELAELLKKSCLWDRKPVILGAGTNVLAPDEGMKGLIICLKDCLDGMERVDGTSIRVMAGVTMARAAVFAASQGLSGLEFAHGIPGTLGGGVVMNAGAYGGEMKDVLYRCDHIDKNGDRGFLEGDDLKLSYRRSAYYDNGCIVTGLYMRLKKDKPEDIKARMDDYLSRRKAKQPLEYPSAGSTFKRPEGYFAGALIEECNLKGASVGGAQVSTKHAGFVINTGGATCKDVLDLCKKVSDTVKAQKGVELEMEIRVTE